MAKSNKNKKSGQSSRAQQQQDAARRRGAGVAAGRGSTPPVQATAQAAPAAPATSGGRTESRHYLDVSAIRIQEWLARTPDLKFRRGGSVLLTEATARGAWTELPSGMCWNDEAGDVDGVVSLVLAGTAAGENPEDQIRAAACEVARKIRQTMPYCPIHAVTGKGVSYADAYQQMADARRNGHLLVSSPPAPPELIVAKPCDQCRSAAAAHPDVRLISGEETKALCDDCHARFNAAGGTAGNSRREPRPEQRMREALGKAGMTVAGFPDNFEQMARAGQLDTDDVASQLALVYADGNSVGTFLSEAAKHVSKRDIVPLIDQATVGALADAVRERFGGWSRPPVLANLAGGDDLLVSVPAADAWLFTRTLLAAFGTRIAEASKDLPAAVRVHSPSLSAGLVFHHLKAPFSDVVRLAADQLDEAKAATRGKAAAIAFLDLTADGNAAPPDRKPVTLADLDRLAAPLKLAGEIPNSRRATLLDLLRRGAADEFIARLTDLDNKPLWAVVTGRPGPAAARETLTGQQQQKHLAELRRVLDIARYWHSEPRAEEA